MSTAAAMGVYRALCEHFRCRPVLDHIWEIMHGHQDEDVLVEAACRCIRQARHFPTCVEFYAWVRQVRRGIVYRRVRAAARPTHVHRPTWSESPFETPGDVFADLWRAKH